MTEAATTPQEPFKVGDLVRVKALKDIPPGHRYKAGLIEHIALELRHPYIVSLPGGTFSFAEDELEKI